MSVFASKAAIVLHFPHRNPEYVLKERTFPVMTLCFVVREWNTEYHGNTTYSYLNNPACLQYVYT